MAGPASEALPSGVVLEEVGCPMGCAGSGTELLRAGDRLHGLPGEFAVKRCDHCGLMRTTPRPTPASMGLYYPEAYAPHVRTAATTAAPGRLARWLAAMGWDGSRELLPPIPVGRALEVGSASGRFMQRLRRRGWIVSGIEPSREAAARAQKAGFPVHAGPLETAPEPEQHFNFVVASHAFEHLHDPVGSFRRLRAWCVPGATMACSVPDAGSVQIGRAHV